MRAARGRLFSNLARAHVDPKAPPGAAQLSPAVGWPEFRV